MRTVLSVTVKIGRALLIGLVAILSACGPDSSARSRTPTSGLVDINPGTQAAVVATVIFASSATTVEMASTFSQISAALGQGSFADIPDMDAFYEEHRITVAWRSVSAGTRGETQLRELLAGSTIVKDIEVVRR